MYELIHIYNDVRLTHLDGEGFILASPSGTPRFRRVGWTGGETPVADEGSDPACETIIRGEERVHNFEHVSMAIRGGRIVASHQETGKRIWAHDISDPGWYADAQRLHKGKVSERLFFAGDRMFFTSGPHVFALDWTDGRELWHIRMPLNEALITLDPGGMLFIKSGYYIYLVDMADGSQLPLLDLEAAATPLSQWLSHGAIQGSALALVDTGRKTLVILDKNDLSLQQELPLPESEAIDTDVTPAFFERYLLLDDRQGLVYWFVDR